VTIFLADILLLCNTTKFDKIFRKNTVFIDFGTETGGFYRNPPRSNFDVFCRFLTKIFRKFCRFLTKIWKNLTKSGKIWQKSDKIWKNLTKYSKLVRDSSVTRGVPGSNFEYFWQIFVKFWQKSDKIWKILTKIWQNLEKFDKNLTKSGKIWQKSDKIWKNLTKIWQNLEKSDKIWKNLTKIWQNLEKSDKIWKKFWQNSDKILTDFDNHRKWSIFQKKIWSKS